MYSIKIPIEVVRMRYAIYLLRNNGVVVYVGQTSRGIIRPFSHHDKLFDEVVFIEGPKNYFDRVNHEDMLINKYKPIYNKTNKKSEGYRSIEVIRKKIKEMNGGSIKASNNLTKYVKMYKLGIEKYGRVVYVHEKDFIQFLWDMGLEFIY